MPGHFNRRKTNVVRANNNNTVFFRRNRNYTVVSMCSFRVVSVALARDLRALLYKNALPAPSVSFFVGDPVLALN